jgi:hypothetical protein
MHHLESESNPHFGIDRKGWYKNGFGLSRFLTRGGGRKNQNKKKANRPELTATLSFPGWP